MRFFLVLVLACLTWGTTLGQALNPLPTPGRPLPIPGLPLHPDQPEDINPLPTPGLPDQIDVPERPPETIPVPAPISAPDNDWNLSQDDKEAYMKLGEQIIAFMNNNRDDLEKMKDFTDRIDNNHTLFMGTDSPLEKERIFVRARDDWAQNYIPMYEPTYARLWEDASPNYKVTMNSWEFIDEKMDLNSYYHDDDIQEKYEQIEIAYIFMQQAMDKERLNILYNEMRTQAQQKILEEKASFQDDFYFPTYETARTEGQEANALIGVVGQNNDNNLYITLGPRVVEFLLRLGAPLILIALVFIGGKMITANSNDEAITESKEYFLYLVIGVIVMALSYSIIRILFSFLVQ